MNFRSFLFVFILLTCISCKKNDGFETDVKMIGHAINGLDNLNQSYPENSFSALEYALSFNQLDGVEIDVQVTNDYKFVCYHDEFLNGKTTGSGRVSDHSLSQILEMQYLGCFNEPIMPLSALHQFDLSEKYVMLDVSFDAEIWNENPEFYLEKLKLAVESIDCKEMYIIHENRNLLADIDIPNVLKIFHVVQFEDGLDWVASGEFDGIIFKNKLLNKTQMKEFENLGLKTIIFEAKSGEKIEEALLKEPDFLMVDDLIKSLEYVKKE